VEAAARIVDAALVVADRPLVVVALGLPVVVQHLGQFGVVACGFDLFGGGMRVGRRGRPGGDILRAIRTRHEGQPNAWRTPPWPSPMLRPTNRRPAPPTRVRRRTRGRGRRARRPDAWPEPPPVRRTGRLTPGPWRCSPPRRGLTGRGRRRWAAGRRGSRWHRT